MKNVEFKMSDFEWIEITMNIKLKPRESEQMREDFSQDTYGQQEYQSMYTEDDNSEPPF